MLKLFGRHLVWLRMTSLGVNEKALGVVVILVK